MKKIPPLPVSRFCNARAEEMRLRTVYRNIALSGRAGPSGPSALAALKRLAGPDCAYHLYGKVI